MDAETRTAIVDEYDQLVKDRDAIEAEIAAIAEELTSGPNAAGLSSPLVDSEGFPRADIDVYRVRHQRHNFACKQTDHRVVMKRIEELLPRLFEARSAAEKPASKPLGGAPPPPTAIPVQDVLPSATGVLSAAKEAITDLQTTKKPFALVDSVQDDSPAALADLRAGDQVLTFGTADATNHRNLDAIKEIVLRNIGSAIRVVVQRASTLPSSDNPTESAWEVCELELTPQKWRGAGVLGCLLLPLPASQP